MKTSNTLTSVASATLLATLVIAAPLPANEVTHGTAIGDVRAESAVVWGRCSQPGELRIRLRSPETTVEEPLQEHTVAVAEADDYTGQIRLVELDPDTEYRVDVACAEAEGRNPSKIVSASFATAPEPEDHHATSFLVSGDLGGQTYCRLAEGGFEIFLPMTALGADFFIANGDMIYADNPCPEVGAEGRTYVPGNFPGIGDPGIDWSDRAQLDQIYGEHWKYNRADPGFQQFLASTPVYVQWDDHEVINDFGASWPFYLPMPRRGGYSTLVQAGRESLFAYHPIERHPDEPHRIYRSFRWGRDLEVFLLDARSYRSRNDVVDEEAGAQKTLLGEAQLRWLVDSVTASDATWKVVSSDVPLSIPTGSGANAYGRDAFASGSTPFGSQPEFASRTGFESELIWLLSEFDRASVSNLVFVTTDVHFAAQIRYEKDFDFDGRPLLFHEIVSGPLSAVKNPAPPALDPTLGPVYLYAEGGIFNFAYLRLVGGGEQAKPRLLVDVRDEKGRVRPGSELVLQPQERP